MNFGTRCWFVHGYRARALALDHHHIYLPKQYNRMHIIQRLSNRTQAGYMRKTRAHRCWRPIVNNSKDSVRLINMKETDCCQRSSSTNCFGHTIILDPPLDTQISYNPTAIPDFCRWFLLDCAGLRSGTLGQVMSVSHRWQLPHLRAYSRIYQQYQLHVLFRQLIALHVIKWTGCWRLAY